MLLTLTLLAGCATGGGSTPAITQPTSDQERPAASMENHNLIGELRSIPAEYTQEASEQGEVVRIDYTTTDYTNPSRSLEKYAYRNGDQYAQALAAQGYLVYCFDFRGGSESSRSEGSNLEMSVFTEQSDLGKL